LNKEKEKNSLDPTPAATISSTSSVAVVVVKHATDA
jgi:hypothetical protein